MERIKKSLLAIFVFLGLVILLTVGQHILWIYSEHSPGSHEDIYQSLAVSIIVSWIIFIVAFYIWAIQFYNINRGWTDESWKRYQEEKEFNSRYPSDQSPQDNPHNNETLGLPPGTVRATLALSLLVLAMALGIASLSMPKTYQGNEFFTDNFEFMKTGFLMMLAFYFGTKSLETLRKTNMQAGTIVQAGESDSNETVNRSSKEIDITPDPVPEIRAEAGTLHDNEAKG